MSTRAAVARLETDLGELLDRHERARDLSEYAAYADDPAGFVRDVLGAEPEPYQADVLRSCATEPRVAWRAAHGTGKTAGLAWVLLWWLLSRPFSRVLVLAPAFERQVGRYLLPEVRRWARGAPEPLPIAVRAGSVEVRGYEREWFALAVQATDPEMIEGGHAESIAVLADEAKGLPADVVAALHGTQTAPGGDRLYMLASVPGGPSGPFYDVFRKGGRFWRTFATSAEDSELVSPVWVEERAEEWGRGSPLFVSRVLGEFPEEDEGTLYKLSDLEAAVGRERPEDEDAALAIGVDPARFGGDRSALAVWRGHTLLRVETRRGLDTMETAAWVAGEINRLKPGRVAVDEIGIGAGVTDRLRQLGHAVDAVNVGAKADRPDLYANSRAELAWRFRQALERAEVALLDDEQLLAELSSFRYDYTPRGLIQLEAKAETKKRVGASPDRADAALLGFPGGSGRRGRDVPGVVPIALLKGRHGAAPEGEPGPPRRWELEEWRGLSPDHYD